MTGKKKKVRVALRKNRQKPARQRDWTRRFQEHGFEREDPLQSERVRAKGELSRHRTVIQEEPSSVLADVPPGEATGGLAVAPSTCQLGRVVRVHGSTCLVETADGRPFVCAVRRLLRTLAIDERNVVAAGDEVLFRPADPDAPAETAAAPAAGGAIQGMIERVEPRRTVVTRASRNREQVLVANVDQLLIVASLAEPPLKTNLIDRYLISAAKGGVRPIICLNKVDLVDPADFQAVIGRYSQLGYPTLFTSADTGQGIGLLRRLLRDRTTALSGQSGVGKSSLLNAVQPGLNLEVGQVSEGTQKGQHTTSAARLIRLAAGGWVVDTPGIRQFELWDVSLGEVEGYFAEFRPYVPSCRFPDCTHTHEEPCAIKTAVSRGQISQARYESYLKIFHNEPIDLE